MDQPFLDAIAKWGLLPALALFALSKLVPMLASARSEAVGESARADIIAQLSVRIDALEAGQRAAWNAHETERKMRISAEDQVAALQRRVSALEAKVIALGGSLT